MLEITEAEVIGLISKPNNTDQRCWKNEDGTYTITNSLIPLFDSASYNLRHYQEDKIVIRQKLFTSILSVHCFSIHDFALSFKLSQMIVDKKVDIHGRCEWEFASERHWEFLLQAFQEAEKELDALLAFRNLHITQQNACGDAGIDIGGSTDWFNRNRPDVVRLYSVFRENHRTKSFLKLMTIPISGLRRLFIKRYLINKVVRGLQIA